MKRRFNIIAAVTDTMGIGKNGELPWRLKSEMAYFKRITSTSNHEGKMNVVLMGRKTWESIPKAHRPLKGRMNIVVTKSLRFPEEEDVFFVRGLDDALAVVHTQLNERVGDVWVIGGASIYEQSIKKNVCDRIYLTSVFKHYDCDVFFPAIPARYKDVSSQVEDIPKGIQCEENGEKWSVKVYEKQLFYSYM